MIHAPHWGIPRGRALLLFALVGALVAVGIVVGSAPLAHAQPSATGSFPTNATVTAQLARTSGTTTVQIPAGTTVTAIHAKLTLEDKHQGTDVRVTVGGTTVTTLDASDGGTRDIDIAGIAATATTRATDDATSLVLGLTYEETSEATTELGCRILPPELTATLSDLTLDLSGSGEAISTVSQFMSGPAQEIIVVSDSQDADTRVAALNAVASAAHVWSDADVHIASALPANVTPTYPGSIRVIRIGDGTGDSAQQVGVTSQGVPLLSLGGSGRAAAAAALGDERIAVADASSTGDLQDSSAVDDSLTQSLADLGTGQLRLSGPGTSSATVTVAQSSFGGPISSLSVRLVGAYTALPDQIVATVNAYWNDDLVDSFVLDGSVAVDRTITIDKTRLKNSNALRLVLSTATANTSACADDLTAIPVQFDVDTGASTLSATRGQTLEAGFSRFPQVLGGHLDVSFDSGTDAGSALGLAGQIVAALQSQVTDQISITETSIEDARSSASPVLILGATSQTADELDAPLRLADFRFVGSSSSSFGVTAGQAYASVEAFESGGRDVLLAGGWAPDDAERSQLSSLTTALTTWIRDAPWGWNSLNDDVLMAGPSGVANFDSGAVVPQQQAIDDYRPVAWWTVGFVVVLIVVLTVGELMRRRRVGQAARAYVAQESDGETAAPGHGVGGSRPGTGGPAGE